MLCPQLIWPPRTPLRPEKGSGAGEGSVVLCCSCWTFPVLHTQRYLCRSSCALLGWKQPTPPSPTLPHVSLCPPCSCPAQALRITAPAWVGVLVGSAEGAELAGIFINPCMALKENLFHVVPHIRTSGIVQRVHPNPLKSMSH